MAAFVAVAAPLIEVTPEVKISKTFFFSVFTQSHEELSLSTFHFSQTLAYDIPMLIRYPF